MSYFSKKKNSQTDKNSDFIFTPQIIMHNEHERSLQFEELNLERILYMKDHYSLKIYFFYFF